MRFRGEIMVEIWFVFIALSLGGILGFFVGAMFRAGSYFEDDENAKN
jgi:Leu/Phe-tRNA-protein transferase